MTNHTLITLPKTTSLPPKPLRQTIRPLYRQKSARLQLQNSFQILNRIKFSEYPITFFYSQSQNLRVLVPTYVTIYTVEFQQFIFDGGDFVRTANFPLEALHVAAVEAVGTSEGVVDHG
jgi:hypothetical protein